MPEYERSLGDSIKRARKRLAMTQQQIAEEAGIDPRTVMNIEDYHGNPKMAVLFPLITYTSQMIGTKSTHFYGSVTYQGVEGNTYYATVTHYAAKGSGSGTEDLTSNSVVA